MAFKPFDDVCSPPFSTLWLPVLSLHLPTENLNNHCKMLKAQGIYLHTEGSLGAGENPWKCTFCLHRGIHWKPMKSPIETPKPELKRYKARSIILSGLRLYRKSHVAAPTSWSIAFVLWWCDQYRWSQSHIGSPHCSGSFPFIVLRCDKSHIAWSSGMRVKSFLLESAMRYL